jgi:hypothetical protein
LELVTSLLHFEILTCTYIVKGPWEHSDHEWSKFESIFIENMKDEHVSFENHCPHIIKIFIICMVNLNY